MRILLLLLLLSSPCLAVVSSFNQYLAQPTTAVVTTNGTFNSYNMRCPTITVNGSVVGFNQYGARVSSITLSDGTPFTPDTPPAPPVSVVTDGLIHWWKLDENTGTNCADSGSSSATATGVLTGTSNWTFRTKSGGASVVAASVTINGYILIADKFDMQFNDNNWSMDFWMCNGKSAECYPLSKDNPDVWGWQLSGGHLSITSGEVHDLGGATYDGAWHHYCYTVQRVPSLDNHIYIDGVDETTDTSGAFSYKSKGVFHFGDLTVVGNVGIVGGLQSIKLYNKTLTQTEVTQNHNAEK